jgi:anion-transporting  ArsA/GET3 family ATPase
VSAEEVLRGRTVCVCAGSGGVGKTSVAAALGLGMAARGARVAVVTIDPARRLASSLGLAELGNEPHRIDPERLAADGLDVPGELWAMMLDPKRTWDDLVARFARDPDTARAILSNRIYRELSTAVAGTQEYMAMEKLHELYDSRDFDLIVLDTPPTRNALDFLDAPRRLTRFIDSTALQLFLAPSRAGFKLFGRGGGVAFGLLERVTGIDLLRELSEFFRSFRDMARGLQDRAEQVEELLGSPEATFVIVTSPERDPTDEAIFFRRRLRRSGMPFGAAVVNRVQPEPGPGADPAGLGRELRDRLGADLAGRVAACLADHRKLAARDRREIARLEDELRGEPLLLVPQLEDDVHDLRGLARLGQHLFATGAGLPARPAAHTGAE